MSNDSINNYKVYFVFGFYLQMFIEENRSKFYNININQIYFSIISNIQLSNEFNYFITKKMYLLAYNEFESKIVHENLLAELN